MKKIISTLIITGLSIQIYGQATNYNPINIKSPESYSYEKMGNIPINLNTGTIDLNIPLLDINIDGFSDRISLNYDSSGFIPTKKSGFAGLNWFVNASGTITREVRGIPDDFYSIQSARQNGFLSAIEYNKTANDIYTKNFQLSTGISTPWPGIYNGSTSSELESDKYNFNFCGISGYFTLSNDGTPLVKSSDPNMIVDISGYVKQNSTEQINCRPDFSSFKIIDGNGNKYYFGGLYDNLEITSDLGKYQTNQTAYQGEPNFTITSWYLYKIELQNGRTITYTYNEDDGMGAGYNYCRQYDALPYAPLMNGYSFSFDLNRYYAQEAINQSAQYDYSWAGYSVTGASQSSTWQSPYIRIGLTKKTMLKEINVDEIYKIFFTYESYTNDLGYRAEKLKKIEENIQNRVTKTIDFTIVPKGGTKRRWFLTALKINDRNYSFEYYKDDFFPDDATRGVDYWGYWNGKSENNMLIPDYKFYVSTGDTEILSNNRDVDSNYNDVGLLKKVTYPTKGYTEFIYEPNSYSSKLIRNSSTNFFPQIANMVGIASGMRIKNTIDYAENSLPVTRSYKYIKTSTSTESSGVLKSLYDFVNYLEYKQSAPGGYTLKKELTQNGSNIELQAYSNSSIEYSNVFEYVDNKLQKQYVFSNYITNPDVLNNSNYFIQTHTPQFAYDHVLQNYLKNRSTDMEDRSFTRGKLIEEHYYKDDQLIKKVTNNYGFIDKSYCKNFSKNNILTISCRNTNQDYSTKVKKISNAWELFQKEYITPYTLLSSQTIDKNINGDILNQKNLSYDDISYLNNNKITTTTSDGKVIAIDRNFPQTLNKQSLINRNMNGIALEEKVSQTIGSATKTLSKIETGYPDTLPNSQTGNLMLPLSIKSYDILNNTASIEITYDKYDSKGNLQQYTTEDGIPVAIIWGYNNTQPIAKVEGATYDQLVSTGLIPAIVAASDADASNPNNEGALITALDAFRNSPALSGYQISAYTYDPLIGITSITQPSGIREVYTYDSFNKLKEIKQQEKDSNGNLVYKIVKEFKYNYKN